MSGAEENPRAEAPAGSRQPGILDWVLIVFGTADVAYFLVAAILFGDDNWWLRLRGLSLLIVLPSYVLACRTIVAWRTDEGAR